MKDLGFRVIGGQEKLDQLRVIGAVAPRKREGSEIGLILTTIHKMSVIVWTSYVQKAGSFRATGEDQCWVVMTDERGRAVYFAKPVKRVGKFLYRLKMRAKAAKERIENRPVCKCGEYMSVVKRYRRKEDGTSEVIPRARYWRCTRWQNHRGDKGSRSTRESWEYGLSEESLRFVKEERKKRRKYRDKRRKEGKEIEAAMKHRRPWKTGKH